jgi:hypothetical protein
LQSESKYLNPVPVANVVIDSNSAIRFPAQIAVKISGDSKELCDSFKTMLCSCSQHVLRKFNTVKSKANVQGPVLVIKLMMSYHYFLRLIAVKIAGFNVLTCLKSKYSASIIFVPTRQIFSYAIVSFSATYLICSEHSISACFGDLLDFMSQTKGNVVHNL